MTTNLKINRMGIGPSADPLAGGIDLQALHREPHQQADQIR
jgi:hypothetical protein